MGTIWDKTLEGHRLFPLPPKTEPSPLEQIRELAEGALESLEYDSYEYALKRIVRVCRREASSQDREPS